MKSLCRSECCEECPSKGTKCAGCVESGGHPCGGRCFAAGIIKEKGFEELEKLKKSIIDEVNTLGIDGLVINELYLLSGSYINLEYTFVNGTKAKLLDDDAVYFGNQIEREGNDRCFGIAADEKYILVCEYGCEGKDPEIVVYKRR